MPHTHARILFIQAAVLAIVTILTCGCSQADTRLHHELKLPVDRPILEDHPGSPVRVMWFGVASLYITDGQSAILIDPYVTRPGLPATLLGTLRTDEGTVERWIERFREIDPHAQVKAVLVSHSHHDHLMDAPSFAMGCNARIAGSPSTLNIASGAGMASASMDDAEQHMSLDRAVFQYGDFKVTFMPSHHGLALAGKVPLPGTVDQPIMPPLRLRDYRAGQVYSILIEHSGHVAQGQRTSDLSILHHASASWKRGVLEDPAVTADVVFLGLAGTETYNIYLRQVAEAVRASVVVPIHYDNPLRSLDRPFRVFLPVKFGKFVNTIEENDEFDDLRLRVLDWKQLYRFSDASHE